MTSLLFRLVRRARPVDLSHWRVTVYTRRQCCCCHAALEALEPYRRRHGFAVEEVDVDSDPALAGRHGLTVPVVEIQGRVRFKGLVNPVLLDRLIEATGRDG